MNRHPATLYGRSAPHPNTLLLIMVLVLILALGVLLYDRYFTGHLVAADPVAATPAPTVAHPFAEQVLDPYCADGKGWQWRERVPDGFGGENWIAKSSCVEPEDLTHAQK
jgi:hypothetical protein